MSTRTEPRTPEAAPVRRSPVPACAGRGPRGRARRADRSSRCWPSAGSCRRRRPTTAPRPTRCRARRGAVLGPAQPGARGPPRPRPRPATPTTSRRGSSPWAASSRGDITTEAQAGKRLARRRGRARARRSRPCRPAATRCRASTAVGASSWPRKGWTSRHDRHRPGARGAQPRDGPRARHRRPRLAHRSPATARRLTLDYVAARDRRACCGSGCRAARRRPGRRAVTPSAHRRAGSLGSRVMDLIPTTTASPTATRRTTRRAGSPSRPSAPAAPPSRATAPGCCTPRRCAGWPPRRRCSRPGRATSCAPGSPTRSSARRSAASSARRSAATPTSSRSRASRTTSATRRSGTTARTRSTRSPRRSAGSRATRRRCGSSPGSRPRRSPATTARARRPVGLNLTRAALDAATKYPWPRREGAAQVRRVRRRPRRLRAGCAHGAPEERALLRGAGHGLGRRRRLLRARRRGRASSPGTSTSARSAAPATRATPRGCSTPLRATPPTPTPTSSARPSTGSPALPFWPTSYDGSLRDLAALKNLTSQLIGRFCAAAERATRAAHGDGRLTRYAADLEVPREQRLEVAVLKAVANRWVMQRVGAESVYTGQRELVQELVVGAAAARRRSRSTRCCARRTRTRADDAARLRVVVDQVASLTDRSVVAWHAPALPLSGGSLLVVSAVFAAASQAPRCARRVAAASASRPWRRSVPAACDALRRGRRSEAR